MDDQIIYKQDFQGFANLHLVQNFNVSINASVHTQMGTTTTNTTINATTIYAITTLSVPTYITTCKIGLAHL